MLNGVMLSNSEYYQRSYAVFVDAVVNLSSADGREPTDGVKTARHEGWYSSPLKRITPLKTSSSRCLTIISGTTSCSPWTRRVLNLLLGGWES